MRRSAGGNHHKQIKLERPCHIRKHRKSEINIKFYYDKPMMYDLPIRFPQAILLCTYIKLIWINALSGI